MKSYLAKISQVWKAPGNRHRKLAAVCWLFFWAIYKRLGRRGIVTSVFSGMKFRCHPASLMAEHVLYLSEYVEYDEMHFMHDFLRPGDRVLDIGANVGLHTLLAASRTMEKKGGGAEVKGRIIAVEPHPQNLEILRENIALNGLENTVSVLPIAAGDVDAELSLNEKDVFSTIGKPAEGGIPVPVRRLDALVDGHTFAVTKIDVEGYEWHTLRGLEKCIKAGALPVIIFELIGHMTRHGGDEKAFCRWLQNHGYKLAKYDHDAETLECSDYPQGDVIAFNDAGLKMLNERMS